MTTDSEDALTRAGSQQEPGHRELVPPTEPFDLGPFAQTNQEATVQREEDAFVVSNPWGDSSVSIRVSYEAHVGAGALNALRLPPAFSCVWHTDTRDLEFIYGPMRVDNELRSRSFVFDFEGRTFRCEFGDASERLVALANAARPSDPPSPSRLRNLDPIRTFLRLRKRLEEGDHPVFAALTSFWIRACDLPEKDLPRFVRHLNFYMRYFDRRTPMIEVHETPGIRAVAQPKRYLFGPFPDHIAGRALDPYMLTLWDSGLPGSTEPLRSFLYNYQALEYAAFYYLKEELARTIRRIVSAPDIVGRADEASRRILDTLVDERTSEEAKITLVVQQSVDPAVLWAEIEAAAEFFAEATEFDGGFSVPPLIKKGWGLDDFRTAWIPKLPDTFRRLRNALLHAREQRLAKCIAPTVRNSDLLRPWSNLISIVSSQIILFGDS